MSLLVVIPFCEKDSKLALDLLGWIAELGKHPDNQCLLVADSRLTKLDYEHHVDAATKVFKSVDVIKTPFTLPDEKWPIGANWSFETTARHVQFHTEHKAWLWLEPDCVPMRESWLADIEADYIKAGKPFMGRLFQPRKEGLPVFMMTGIGVYPHDLPKRMFQRLVSMRGKAWDVSCADLIVPQAHHTRLFWNFHNRNDQPTYRLILKEDSPKNSILVTSIDPKAALVHTCKDGSLIQRLRILRSGKKEEPEIVEVKSEPEPEPPKPYDWNKLAKKDDKIFKCFHSGDLGDIIYGLLFAYYSLKKIDLILGPDLSITLRNQMNPETFNWLKPLFECQSWINSVTYSNSVPQVDYNLNDFRKTWFSKDKKAKCLFQAYSEQFGKRQLPEKVPWLDVEPMPVKGRPVVINRTERYQSPSFSWSGVSASYANRMLFVGTPQEHRDWVNKFGATAEYRPVSNALELARLIKGAKLFVGNQSFPMSLALAMNVPIVQETCHRTPDCVFRRPNALYSLSGMPKLPDIGSDHVFVSNTRNGNGIIELGPCADATGLGDFLSITPVASKLRDAVVLLPPSLAKWAELFRGICPTAIRENVPHFKHVGGVNMCESKLRLFGLPTNDCLPIVRVTEVEKNRAAEELKDIQNPIAFCPSCSKTWEHIRSRPPEFFEPIVKKLSERHSVLQFGREDYPTIPGCKRMPFYNLRRLAAVYSIIGKYIGVNTGDYHLMLAVGGKCVIIDADKQVGYDPAEWRYNSDRVTYIGFGSQDEIVNRSSFL